MDLLKTPKQLLMEDAGMHPASEGLLMTPQQKLMQESGMIPRFAQGKQVLSPKDMKAEIFVNKTASPKSANGDPYSNPALIKAWNNIFK
jgi:hypothetical protein